MLCTGHDLQAAEALRFLKGTSFSCVRNWSQPVRFVSVRDFTDCGRATLLEGYELQLVHNWSQTNPALAAEGSLLPGSATSSAACWAKPFEIRSITEIM